MDVDRIQQEMRARAEERIDVIADPDAICPRASRPRSAANPTPGSTTWSPPAGCRLSQSADPNGSRGRLSSRR